MKKLSITFMCILVLSGCNSGYTVKNIDSARHLNFSDTEEKYDYEDGYSWAEDEDTDNFDDCQSQFGSSEAENGCNDYVKDNHTGSDTFYGYRCTEDCSGHEAGYDWAERNGINDIYDCDGNSQSFIEGCQAYVEENY